MKEQLSNKQRQSSEINFPRKTTPHPQHLIVLSGQESNNTHKKINSNYTPMEAKRPDDQVKKQQQQKTQKTTNFYRQVPRGQNKN